MKKEFVKQILYFEVSEQSPVPEQVSRRYYGETFESFYLRSLLPDDFFARMNPRERFTEAYVMTADENIYKIFSDAGRLVVIDGGNAVRYDFTDKEMTLIRDPDYQSGIISRWQGIAYGGQFTDQVMTIACLSTAISYSAADVRFRTALRAHWVEWFKKQQVNLSEAVTVPRFRVRN